MENNLLLNKIQEIQNEYKDILTNIISDLEGPFRRAALDQIILFWIKNKPIVNMFLRYYLSTEDAYVMTAVTYLDVEAGEQYPFFLMGSVHILDDPLAKYCEICNGIESNQEVPLESEIIKCAKDNLRVLKEYSQIMVLPLRLFREKEKEKLLKETCKQLFLSLLTNITTDEEYFSKIISVEDIESEIKGCENLIILSADDDISLPFSTRFEKTRHLLNAWFPQELTDGQRFYFLINGYLSQAMDIIMSCGDFSLTPYIRFNLSLNYFLLCADAVEKEGIIDCKRDIVCLSHIIYKIVDVERLRKKGDKTFFEAKDKTEFWERVKQDVGKIVFEQGEVERIAKIVENNLEILYSEIEKEE